VCSNLGVGGALRLEVEREQQLSAGFADLREARVEPFAQFPVLYGVGIALAEECGALGEGGVIQMLACDRATVAFHQAPGVAAGDGGKPGAEAAIVAQSVQALDQDGESKLRDVGSVMAGQPVA
jgi:hypothetical protein